MAVPATAKYVGGIACTPDGAVYVDITGDPIADLEVEHITFPAFDVNHGTFDVYTANTYYGTAGTLTGVTGTTNGSTSLTSVSANTVANGSYITITGETGAFVVNAGGGTATFTLNRAASTSSAGHTIQYIRQPDPTLLVGYNPLQNVSGEPKLTINIESDFLDTDGYRKMEVYAQYNNSAGTNQIRPWLFQFNRDLDTLVGGYFTVGTGGFRMQTAAAAYVTQFQPSGQVDFHAGGAAFTNFQVYPYASSVNYFSVTGGVSTVSPSLTALGADSNLSVVLTPKGTGVVQVRNGTTSTGVEAYNTVDGTLANYERIAIRYVSNEAHVYAENGGTGTARVLVVGTQGNAGMQLKTNGTLRLTVANNGSEFSPVDNVTALGTTVKRFTNVYASTSFTHQGANGQALAVKALTELTTIAAAATTDTTIQMPAGAIVLAVSVRVTTVIPTATNFTVGDSGSAARFSTAAVSAAATSTDPGTKAGAYYNATALSIRITPDGTPAANTGRVRVTIYYLESTPPTS